MKHLEDRDLENLLDFRKKYYELMDMKLTMQSTMLHQQQKLDSLKQILNKADFDYSDWAVLNKCRKILESV